MSICAKFHQDSALASLTKMECVVYRHLVTEIKFDVTKKCDGRTDAGQKKIPSVSVMPEAGDTKTTLTINFNLCGTDGRTTNGQTDQNSICPIYFVCRGIKYIV